MNTPSKLSGSKALSVGLLAGLVAGLAMVALPGPGWLTIAAALAILAGEYVWARRLLERLKSHAGRLRRRRTTHD